MTPTYTPLLSGEVMAFSASVLAFAAVLVSKARNQAVRLRGSGSATSAGPLLFGIYRGRAVEMTLAACGTLSITAQVTNTARHAAEFGQSDPLRIPWIPPLCRHRLKAWSGDWNVAVRGKNLFFTCHLPDNAPERMGRALDLTCDIADAVDVYGRS